MCLARCWYGSGLWIAGRALAKFILESLCQTGLVSIYYINTYIVGEASGQASKILFSNGNVTGVDKLLTQELATSIIITTILE
jgi:hypothetical protein